MTVNQTPIDPLMTVLLLRSLEQSGLSDELFKQLHHFPSERAPTIQQHIDYCLSIESYQPDNTNEHLHNKLVKLIELLN